jgi:hypothetical protein
MSSCDLIVRGTDFNVDLYLNVSTLKATKVFHRGEPTGSRLHPSVTSSGFRIDICATAEDQLDVQIRKATNFLKAHGEDLRKLAEFPGVEEIELSIGLFWLSDTMCYPISLPPDFLFVAGKHGVLVTLNVFATSEPEEIKGSE